MQATREIKNFGGNVRFRPRSICQPATEDELLSILRDNRDSKIRVVASRHAWSEAIETDGVLIDMRQFDHVRIFQRDGQWFAMVGGGCKIKHLLKALNAKGLTMPSVGLINEQTIAGATATGTHGSGKHSLSHYLQSVRLACFDETGKQAQIVEIDEGDALRAARCSLGCLGVIVEMTLPCIPQYYVREKATRCRGVQTALSYEARSPLQQFYLLPQAWTYLVQERSVADENRRSATAWLYRIYWFIAIDIGIHVFVKLFASILRSRRLVHLFYRRLVPACIFPGWVVVDRSDRQLVMEHELFRHLELEAFVIRSHVVEAARCVEEILKVADDANESLSSATREKLQTAGLFDELEAIRGRFTHHYPICFRRVLPDDTLISMSCDTDEDWYAISFITYVEPRDDFYAVATFLANSLFELFGARIHWGKWFPHTAEQVGQLYPKLHTFRQACQRHDPKRVFCNRFVDEKLTVK